MQMLTAVLAVLLVSSDPLETALKRVDEKVLRAHENVLASDAFEGRAAGFPGNEKAVAYLLKEVTSYGLIPAGADGGYTQEFAFARGQRRAKNVIGLWEGSDPRLKKEFVVIGAHLDHVGKKGQNIRGQLGGATEDDGIWNGADDNASGTSTLLAVARAFAKGRLRARRSILFCWWNAEEAGLIGSRYWVANPTRPLGKVVYCLNVDMIGRNPQRPVDVEGVKNAAGDALETILTEAFDAEELKYTKYDHYHQAMFRSDGVSFLRQGIPASMLFTYWHADYHRVGDHVEKIAYPRLAKIARASMRILYAVGNLKKPLRLNLDTPLRNRPLGIRGEPVEGRELSALKLGDGNGAGKVTSVSESSVLGKAGLRKGDLVVGFNTSPLPEARPLAEVWKRTLRVPVDEEIPLEIIRDGRRLTLQVVWPKRR